MSGMDRETGRMLPNLDHAYQSVEVILGTRIGSRVMRRQFGGGVVELLGRAVTPQLFAAFQQLIGTAIDIWEPRLRVRRVSIDGSVEALRAGRASFVFEVDYRPRGHLGDFRVERVVTFRMFFRSSQVEVVGQ